MTEEIWKSVDLTELDYAKYLSGNIEASSLGRIKRNGVLLELQNNHGGYKVVAGTIVRVNRVVCYAFHNEDYAKGLHAGHLNDVRSDNRASNLKWMTAKENNTWNGRSALVGKKAAKTRSERQRRGEYTVAEKAYYDRLSKELNEGSSQYASRRKRLNEHGRTYGELQSMTVYDVTFKPTGDSLRCYGRDQLCELTTYNYIQVKSLIRKGEDENFTFTTVKSQSDRSFEVHQSDIDNALEEIGAFRALHADQIIRQSLSRSKSKRYDVINEATGDRKLCVGKAEVIDFTGLTYGIVNILCRKGSYKGFTVEVLK